MKIAPKIADAYIAAPDPAHRALLLYGPDGGLARERAGKLAAHFLSGIDDPMAKMELSDADLASDPARLSDEIAAISLMVPRRAILIRDGGDKLTRAVESAAGAFNRDTLLIICAGELGPRSSLRAWFEKDERAGCVACYHDEVRDLQSVIAKAFSEAGVQADRDVLAFLSQQLGNDRYVTRQELQKLITYAGDSKTLTLEDARALVDYNRDASFDDMVNAVADRNLGALERTLTLLLHESAPPVAYLRACQRYFNRLYAIRAQMDQGRSAEEVVQSLKPPVFFRQAPLLTRHAQGWTTPQIVRALRLLVSAELACKTTDLPPIPASGRRLMQVTQAR